MITDRNFLRMKFPKILFRRLRRFVRPLPLVGKSKLCRAFKNNSDFTISTGRISHRRLMPRNGETSLTNVSGLSDIEIWEHRDTLVLREPRARADFIYSKLAELNNEQNTNLKATSDRSPPRHVSLKNWPESKDAQMHLAKSLAKKASLFEAPAYN